MAGDRRDYIEGIMFCVSVAKEWAAFCRSKRETKQAAACDALARVFMSEADSQVTPPRPATGFCPECGSATEEKQE